MFSSRLILSRFNTFIRSKCVYNTKNYHSSLLVPKFCEIQRQYDFNQQNCLLKSLNVLNVQKRFKKSQKNKAEDSDSDSDSESQVDLSKWINEDPTLNKISKVLKLTVSSMRMDSIVKSGLGVSRNKIEVVFYESKLRLNGAKTTKKSATINIGDEIDIIKGPSPDNPKNLIVSRLEVLDAIPKSEKIVVIVRRYKSLIIEDYGVPFVNAEHELS